MNHNVDDFDLNDLPGELADERYEPSQADLDELAAHFGVDTPEEMVYVRTQPDRVPTSTYFREAPMRGESWEGIGVEIGVYERPHSAGAGGGHNPLEDGYIAWEEEQDSTMLLAELYIRLGEAERGKRYRQILDLMWTDCAYGKAAALELVKVWSNQTDNLGMLVAGYNMLASRKPSVRQSDIAAILGLSEATVCENLAEIREILTDILVERAQFDVAW